MLKPVFETQSKQCESKLSQINLCCRLIVFLDLLANLVLRTPDFVGSPSLISLNLPQSWSPPKCLSRPNHSSHRVLLAPSNNENPYSHKTKRVKRKASYTLTAVRGLEKMLSASFPYSLGRMCKLIPTVRIQSHPLTPIFPILKFLNETIN